RRPIASKVRATFSDFGVGSPLTPGPPDASAPRLLMTEGGLREGPSPGSSAMAGICESFAGGAALRNSFSQTVPMAASPASCQIGAKRIGPIQPIARTYRGHDGNVKPKAARRPPGRVSPERAGTPGFPGEKRARRAAERRPVRQVLEGRI